MADTPRSPGSSGRRTVRGQKIIETSSSSDRPPTARSHTPGHLASKSHSSSTSANSKRKNSEPSIRQRSQSAVSKATIASPPPPQSAATPVPTTYTIRRNNTEPPPVPSDSKPSSETARGEAVASSSSSSRRPAPMRSTSAIKPASLAIPNAGQTRKNPSASTPSTSRTGLRGVYTAFPPLQDPATAADVPAAPSSGMYWSRAPVSGQPHKPVRAHTTTLVNGSVYVFGGCDSRACFNDLHVLDADAFHWSTPHVTGDIPVPLRAMTCTAVGKKLVVFGGGDGPAYYNDVYVLDTVNFRWHRPRIVGDAVPSARRAHTACLHRNGIYVFGGGDGVRALNDIWRLDVSDTNKMSWRLISGSDGDSRASNSNTPDDSSDGGGGGGRQRGNAGAGVAGVSKPLARGYHTANMVGSKLIIYGGSDGGECFDDVWVYDVDAQIWKNVMIPVPFQRLSHTSTLVGSYLFIIGGHDGQEYTNDVLLLNLVTMSWDRRGVYGLPPAVRGYHGSVLHDSRLLVIGGSDGTEVFGDVWILELAVHAYYSQISHFTIEV
ncbi:galactose oxidase [Xylariaceae sp. FL0255]|nr:galactose oxidase [Xylariaceae sp. FL0255]